MTEREQEAWDRFAAAFAQAFASHNVNGLRHVDLAEQIALQTDALMTERAKRNTGGTDDGR